MHTPRPVLSPTTYPHQVRRHPLEPSPLGTSGAPLQSALNRHNVVLPATQALPPVPLTQNPSSSMPVYLPAKDSRPPYPDLGPTENAATTSGSEMENIAKDSTLKRHRSRKHSSAKPLPEGYVSNPPRQHLERRAEAVGLNATSAGLREVQTVPPSAMPQQSNHADTSAQRARKGSNASQYKSSPVPRHSPVLMVPPRIHYEEVEQPPHPNRDQALVASFDQAPRNVVDTRATPPLASIPAAPSRTPSMSRLHEPLAPSNRPVESHTPPVLQDSLASRSPYVADPSPTLSLHRPGKAADTPPARVEQHQVWHPPTPASMPSHAFEAKLPPAKSHASAIMPSGPSVSQKSQLAAVTDSPGRTPVAGNAYASTNVAKPNASTSHQTPPYGRSLGIQDDNGTPTVSKGSPLAQIDASRSGNEATSTKDVLPDLPVAYPVSATVGIDARKTSPLAPKDASFPRASPTTIPRMEPDLTSAPDARSHSQASSTLPPQNQSSIQALAIPRQRVSSTHAAPATSAMPSFIPSSSQPADRGYVRPSPTSHRPDPMPPPMVTAQSIGQNAGMRPSHERSVSDQAYVPTTEKRVQFSSTSGTMRNPALEQRSHSYAKPSLPGTSAYDSHKSQSAVQSSVNRPSEANGISGRPSSIMPNGPSTASILPLPTSHQPDHPEDVQAYDDPRTRPPPNQVQQNPPLTTRSFGQTPLQETTPPYPISRAVFGNEPVQLQPQVSGPAVSAAPATSLLVSSGHSNSQIQPGSSIQRAPSVNPSYSNSPHEPLATGNIGNSAPYGPNLHRSASVRPGNTSGQAGNPPALGRPAKYARSEAQPAAEDSSLHQVAGNVRTELPHIQPETQPVHSNSSAYASSSQPAPTIALNERRTRRDSGSKPEPARPNVPQPMWNTVGMPESQQVRYPGDFPATRLEPRPRPVVDAQINSSKGQGIPHTETPTKVDDPTSRATAGSHVSPFSTMRTQIQNPRLLELLSSPASQAPANRNDSAKPEASAHTSERPPIPDFSLGRAIVDAPIQSDSREFAARAPTARDYGVQPQPSSFVDAPRNNKYLTNNPNATGVGSGYYRPPVNETRPAVSTASQYAQAQTTASNTAPSERRPAQAAQIRQTSAFTSGRDVRPQDSLPSAPAPPSKPPVAPQYPSAPIYPSSSSAVPFSTSRTTNSRSHSNGNPSNTHNASQSSNVAQPPQTANSSARYPPDRDYPSRSGISSSQQAYPTSASAQRPSAPIVGSQVTQAAMASRPAAPDPVQQRPGSAMGYRAPYAPPRPQHQHSSSVGLLPSEQQGLARGVDENSRPTAQRSPNSYPQPSTMAPTPAVPAHAVPESQTARPIISTQDHARREPQRRESNDSLKTPSSLAPSVLKPIISRTSQTSQQEPRKKVGFLGFFKPKATQPSDSRDEDAAVNGRRSSSSKPDAVNGAAKRSLPSATRSKQPTRNAMANGHPPVASAAPTSKVFSPFRYLTSKRHRTVSAASAEAQDGTAPNTVINSPTVSMHSQVPPPPVRDVQIAVQQWTTDAAQGDKINRPGVVFDVGEDSLEDIKPGPPRLARRGTGRRPHADNPSRANADASSRMPAEPSSRMPSDSRYRS
ncbi:hypothetical protein HGRIS_013139 [Hohenbuehelia grisea]|uniref:Uncharacterized protein n=1 Tax=Hohenbuehelia grisea TaxID=104357 RepID=A0ABR3IUR3_9AGAR